MNEFLSKLIEDFEDWGSCLNFISKHNEKVAPKSEQKIEKCEQTFSKTDDTTLFNRKEASWIGEYFSNLFQAKTGKKVRDIKLSEWSNYNSIVMDCIDEIANKILVFGEDKAKRNFNDTCACGKCGEGCDCEDDHNCNSNSTFTNGSMSVVVEEEAPKSIKLVSNDDNISISCTFSSNDNENIKHFMDKIAESREFDNFSMVMSDGTLYPIKIEESKVFEEPKPTLDMDEVQTRERVAYDRIGVHNDFSEKNFNEVIKKAYFIEFRNGNFASLQSFGKNDTEVFFDVDSGYVFYEHNFDKNGKCNMFVKDASDWDIIAMYGNTISPYYPLSLTTAPCIWEADSENFMRF